MAVRRSFRDPALRTVPTDAHESDSMPLPSAPPVRGRQWSSESSSFSSHSGASVRRQIISSHTYDNEALVGLRYSF